ncbi:MAG: hypothetical protein KC425_19895 [Anaerolineales bacterium]|nr:hypothetical protein [Anaerolineales bacterium]
MKALPVDNHTRFAALWRKAGLALMTAATVAALLFARPGVTHAGGGCSTTTGECNGSMTQFDG